MSRAKIWIATAKNWFVAARYIALPQVIIPCFLGGFVAFYQGKFQPLPFGIVVVGLAAVGLGTFLLDDYFDVKQVGLKARQEVQKVKGTLRTVKAPLVADGTIQLQHLLYVGLGLFGIGALACAYLTIVSGWVVLALSLAGALICFFYSAPPVKLGYRGFGEISVTLTTGPMICFGTYYALTNSISLEPILASFPIGIMIGTILYVHSIMDLEPDKAVGKRTLAVISRSQQKAIWMLPFPLALSYAIIIIGVVLKMLPPTALLALLTIPMAYKLFKLMLPLGKGDFSDIRRRWWKGPMEMKVSQMEWFMTRWYLARNLFIATTLFIFIGYTIALFV